VFLLAFVEVFFQYYKQPSSNIIYLHRFEEPEAPGSRSFFTEIIASISDIKFSRDGRHILSRDYMTLKVWVDIIAKVLVHIIFIEFVVCLLDSNSHRSQGLLNKTGLLSMLCYAFYA
jgi:hypothetical protein